MNASKCFKYILLLFATKIIIGIISFCANKVSTSIIILRRRQRGRARKALSLSLWVKI